MKQVYSVDKNYAGVLAKRTAANFKLNYDNDVDDFTVKANYNDNNEIIYNVTLYKGYLGFPGCEVIAEKSYIG